MTIQTMNDLKTILLNDKERFERLQNSDHLKIIARWQVTGLKFCLIYWPKQLVEIFQKLLISC